MAKDDKARPAAGSPGGARGTRAARKEQPEGGEVRALPDGPADGDG